MGVYTGMENDQEIKQQMLPEPTIIGITLYVLGCMLKAVIGFFTLKFLRYWWKRWFGEKTTKEEIEDEELFAK